MSHLNDQRSGYAKMTKIGLDSIQKADFFAVISEIREKSLKEKSIKKAFKYSGIWPFNPEEVLQKIRELHPTEAEEEEEEAQSSTPPITPNNQRFSSPFKTPQTLRQLILAGVILKQI